MRGGVLSELARSLTEAKKSQDLPSASRRTRVRWCNAIRVKALRRGRGRLMAEVPACVPKPEQMSERRRRWMCQPDTFVFCWGPQ